MAAKNVAVFPLWPVNMRMLVTVLKWLTDFFTGAIIETRKAARSKVVASPPVMASLVEGNVRIENAKLKEGVE